MYAQLVQQLPDGKDWLYEVKFDGYRCLAGRDAAGVTLWSRRGNDFTAEFPNIAKACEQLPAGTLLDGEIVAVDENGRISFNLMQHHRSQAHALRGTRATVEKEFYTDSVDVDVDEAITELERKLGTTLDDLRRETSFVRIAGEKIVAFIANLLVRTQALRQKALSNADMSVDYFAKRLEADPGLLSRLTQHEAKKRRMSL